MTKKAENSIDIIYTEVKKLVGLHNQTYTVNHRKKNNFLGIT